MILSLLIGAILGAIWAKIAPSPQSNGEASSLRWRRTAVYGAMIGLLFHSFSGGTYKHPKNVKPVTETNFQAEVLQAGIPVVADFYAPWCGPCKKLAPVLDQMAREYSNQVKFVSINVDENPALAEKFKVQGIPTLLFFEDDGKLTDTVVGFLKKQQLQEKVAAIAAGPLQSSSKSSRTPSSNPSPGPGPTPEPNL